MYVYIYIEIYIYIHACLQIFASHAPHRFSDRARVWMSLPCTRGNRNPTNLGYNQQETIENGNPMKSHGDIMGISWGIWGYHANRNLMEYTCWSIWMIEATIMRHWTVVFFFWRGATAPSQKTCNFSAW